MYKYNPISGVFDMIGDIEMSNLLFSGDIETNNDFPTLGEVENGFQYYIKVPVTDDNPAKTNTLQSFVPGDYIIWNGTDWTVVPAVLNWGSIGGLLSNQGDLKSALDSKLSDLSTITTDDLAEGVSNKYLTGNEFQKNINTSDNINVGTNNLFMSSTEKTKLANITDYFKGYFVDETSLNIAFPTGNSGEYALVGGGGGDTFFYWDETNDLWVDTGSTSVGDMQKSIYDPTNKNADAFSMDNMSEGADTKILTSAERTAISQNTTDITTLNNLKANKSNVLEKNNLTAYTPTSAYHPATKDYVDQNILSGGMPKYVYDPNDIAGDVFDMDNMIDGSINKLLTIGAQNIQGVKTFNSSPIVPTPTTGTQAVNKDYADLKQATSEKGQPNGYASLDSAGLIPTSQLPSYVDDVLEYASILDFPVTGESGKIYVALDENKQYRWGGTEYIQITDGKAVWGGIDGTLSNQIDLQNALNSKQDTLVSQINIKSINGESIVGPGDLIVTAGSGGYAGNIYLTNLTSTTNPAYKQTSYTPEETQTTITGTANNNEVLVGTYIFDADIGVSLVDAGLWTFSMYGNISSAAGVSRVRVEQFKRTAGGVETTMFSATSFEIDNTSPQLLKFETTQPLFEVDPTDRLGLRIYFNTTATANRTITIYVGDGNASYFNTPLALRHNQLRARDAVDCHPMSAITGLNEKITSEAVKYAIVLG